MTIEEVLQAEDARWAAMTTNDFDALDQLLHEQLSYTHSNALVDTKASYMHNLTEGIVDYQTADREDTAAITAGGAVVVTGKVTIGVNVMGQDKVLNCRYTSVWVKDDGRWQFFAWQNTPFPS